MHETITVELIDYCSDRHEYKAELEGRAIIVDPYVGCAWGNERIKLGIFTFEGHWYQDKKEMFLPNKEVDNFN